METTREPHVSIEGALHDLRAGVITTDQARDMVLEYAKKGLIDAVGPCVRDLTAVRPDHLSKSLARQIIIGWIDRTL